MTEQEEIESLSNLIQILDKKLAQLEKENAALRGFALEMYKSWNDYIRYTPDVDILLQNYGLLDEDRDPTKLLTGE